jgi:hypothetical protein
MKARKESTYDVVKDLDELKKDPKKWEEFMASQAEKALKHLRGRKTKQRGYRVSSLTLEA